MKASEICFNCRICGEGIDHIGDEQTKLVHGDVEARTLVIMNHRFDWKEVLDKLMGSVPYAVTFAVRCTPSKDADAQKVNCSIFTRQLTWAFDAFVVEGSVADDIFKGIDREAGITITSLGPVVFIDDFGALRKQDYGRFGSAITTMQELKSGRVLRKGIIQ